MASRNILFENDLCKAIKNRLLVELRFGDDLLWRTFEPQAVYKTTQGNFCVSGVQLKNDNEPLEPSKPHNFTISKITSIRITETHFEFDPTFNPLNKKFSKGIICRIESGKVS
jgi:hypothetical protein